jgi:protein O-GlcNAc transferase
MQAHQRGLLAEAEESYRRLLRAHPGHAAAHEMLGVLLGQRGDAAGALLHLEQAVALDARSPTATNNLGEALRRAGDDSRAEQCFRQAIVLQPAFAEAHYNLANLLKHVGRIPEALAAYQYAIHLRPNYAAAHYNLANLCWVQGDLDAALASYRQAITYRPNFAAAYTNLGAVLQQLGQSHAAEQAYRTAVGLDAQQADVHSNLGKLLIARGDRVQAVVHYRQAARLLPHDSAAAIRLGDLLLDLGDNLAAAEAYRAALKDDPDHADAHNNLGVALAALRRYDEAIGHYLEAVRLDPQDDKLRRNLGVAYEQAGDIAKARAIVQSLIGRRGHSAGPQAGPARDDATLLRLKLAGMCPRVMPDNAAIDMYRAELAAELAALRATPVTLDPPRLQLDVAAPPFALAYHGRDDRPLKEAWAALFIAPSAPHRARHRDGLPHIGFVVTQGHERVFIRSMKGILVRLPVRQLRLSVFCSTQHMAERIRSALARPEIEVIGAPAAFDGLLETLYQAACDVLYYWEVGSDAINYFLPFFRPAPVQCVGWGSPVTTGVPAIDYYLSSVPLEAESGAMHYSEQLILLRSLPGCISRPAFPERPLARSYFSLNDQQHIYLCAQNILKLHPDFDELAATILRRDHTGILVLLGDHAPQIKALKARFQRHMPDVCDRVRFFPQMPEPKYLSLVACADVALDTPHYSGANTSYDAFAAGTPVVALPGAFQRSRYTAALYDRMEMRACVARSAAEYTDMALALGTDRAYRADLSARIVAARPALFDDLAIVGELTEVFQTMAHV